LGLRRKLQANLEDFSNTRSTNARLSACFLLILVDFKQFFEGEVGLPGAGG